MTFNNFTYNDNTLTLNTGGITYNSISYNFNECNITYMFLSTIISEVIYK